MSFNISSLRTLCMEAICLQNTFKAIREDGDIKRTLRVELFERLVSYQRYKYGFGVHVFVNALNSNLGTLTLRVNLPITTIKELIEKIQLGYLINQNIKVIINHKIQYHGDLTLAKAGVTQDSTIYAIASS